MWEQETVCLAAVSVLAVLEQAYFAFQVIYARRKYSVSPPATSGPPAFERVFRAQANCAEYFPIFITLLWTCGLFFSQGVSVVCGVLYLYARLRYFQGYTEAAMERLAPLHLSAHALWLLIGFSSMGIVLSFSRVYLELDLLEQLALHLL